MHYNNNERYCRISLLVSFVDIVVSIGAPDKNI